MGTFSVQIAVGDYEGQRWTTLDALVDTGASITSVPASVLRELGVEPLAQERFRFAQGETRTMDVGQTWLRVEDRERITLVLFNEEGTVPLLGALALEAAFMAVDPVAQKLVPTEGLMM
ncbi:MAG: aspartyl protease family protein [Dehalococcoidia bacterium]|nr:aspartyl protease family protein [Dehalococcoidia bacterium]